MTMWQDDQAKPTGLWARRLAEPRPIAGRPPPHNLEAERAVLSAVLLHGQPVLDQVSTVLRAEHFHSEAHRLVFETMQTLSTQARPLDVLTVFADLAQREKAQQVGGITYIAELLDGVPAVSNPEAYATTVADLAAIRRMIATCQHVAADGYGAIDDARGWLAASAAAVQAVAEMPAKGHPVSAHEAMTETFQAISDAATSGRASTAVPTGFSLLDTKLAGGFEPGQLVIVAARPGVGKSALATCLAVNDAAGSTDTPGSGVAIFSLEMPRHEVMLRMVSAESGVPLARIRSGHTTMDDWSKLTEAASLLASLPIWVDDAAALPLSAIRAKVRHVAAEAARRNAPLRLVIIDYLQLMAPETRKRNPSREEEVAAISKGLKAMAKDLGVAVVALSQLSREVEKRSSGRPQLSDLRESGSIEQDADVVLFLHRDKAAQKPHVVECIIAKQRNGPIGSAWFHWDGDTVRFSTLAPEEVPLDAT